MCFRCEVVVPRHDICSRFRVLELSGRVLRGEPHGVAADKCLPARGRRAPVGTVVGIPEQHVYCTYLNAQLFCGASCEYDWQALAHFCRGDAYFGSRAFVGIQPRFNFGRGFVGRATAETGVLVRGCDTPGEAAIAFLPRPVEIVTSHIALDPIDALVQTGTLTHHLAG